MIKFSVVPILLLALAAPALAQDDLSRPSPAQAKPPRSDLLAERAFTFASAHGILGMRELVDARVPEETNVRAQVRLETDSVNLDSKTAAYFRDDYRAEQIVGASALGFLDGGLVLAPPEVVVSKFHFHGMSSHRDHERGLGDSELAAKVAHGFEWLSVGAFAIVHGNTGAERLEHTNTLEAGGCATASFLDQRLALHLNLAFVDDNAWKIAFDYRLGASAAVVATEPAIVRVFGYLDGREQNGAPGSGLRAAGGFQLLLVRVVTLELSTDVKFHDGDLPREVHDVGTFGVGLAAGASVSF